MVLVVREDRASVLEAAARQPKYAGHTWRMIAGAASEGWTALGGPTEWGKLKMAQSNPLKSNSGMLTLALLYREFRRDNPAQNYDSPEFLAYMAKVEGAVSHFADTTSDALKDLTDGAENQNKPDIAVAYESEALAALGKRIDRLSHRVSRADDSGSGSRRARFSGMDDGREKADRAGLHLLSAKRRRSAESAGFRLSARRALARAAGQGSISAPQNGRRQDFSPRRRRQVPPPPQRKKRA